MRLHEFGERSSRILALRCGDSRCRYILNCLIDLHHSLAEKELSPGVELGSQHAGSRSSPAIPDDVQVRYALGDRASFAIEDALRDDVDIEGGQHARITQRDGMG